MSLRNSPTRTPGLLAANGANSRTSTVEGRSFQPRWNSALAGRTVDPRPSLSRGQGLRGKITARDNP